jgi:hypothetical protein
VDKNIASKYNPGFKNTKGFDQFFLTDQVWPITKTNATIHDSYTCKSFIGSPFPTKRIGACFVGRIADLGCELNNSSYMICPQNCRPKDHQEWIYC